MVGCVRPQDVQALQLTDLNLQVAKHITGGDTLQGLITDHNLNTTIAIGMENLPKRDR
jgi:hypothetical protein